MSRWQWPLKSYSKGSRLVSWTVSANRPCQWAPCRLTIRDGDTVTVETAGSLQVLAELSMVRGRPRQSALSPRPAVGHPDLLVIPVLLGVLDASPLARRPLFEMRGDLGYAVTVRE